MMQTHDFINYSSLSISFNSTYCFRIVFNVRFVLNNFVLKFSLSWPINYCNYGRFQNQRLNNFLVIPVAISEFSVAIASYKDSQAFGDKVSFGF